MTKKKRSRKAKTPENFIVPAPLVRAAMTIKASQDVRERLNWVCVCPNGDVQATDGHTAFVGCAKDTDMFDLPGAETLIKVNGSIGAKYDQLFFEHTNPECGVVHMTSQQDIPDKILSFEVYTSQDEEMNVDSAGKPVGFPDIRRLLDNLREEPITHIGFYGAILSKIGKVYGGFPVDIRMHGVLSPVVAQSYAGIWSEYENQLLCMPASVLDSAEDSRPLNGFGEAERPEPETTSG